MLLRTTLQRARPRSVIAFGAMTDECDITSVMRCLPPTTRILHPARSRSEGTSPSVTTVRSRRRLARSAWMSSCSAQFVSRGSRMQRICQRRTMVVLPALAVSDDGARLGRGGGWYDRLLDALPRARSICVVHSSRVVPAIPAEPHDRRVSWIVTEAGVSRCGR